MCESYSRKRGEGAVSLQRIILGARNARGAVSCRRVGTSSLRKGELLHARSTYQPRKGIVSLVAARLVIDSVRLLALPDELLRDRPWLRPHGRIVNRDHVFEGSRPDPRPALDQMQVLARALKIRLRAEVRYVDDEGVALPVPTRIAIPLADAGRQMGAPVHHDAALPPLSLTHVVEHRDAARRLHDPVRALASDSRQPGGQAADRRRAVLRTIMAIDRYRVVAGGRSANRGEGVASYLPPAQLRYS